MARFARSCLMRLQLNANVKPQRNLPQKRVDAEQQ
jgi:hypothetical protein